MSAEWGYDETNGPATWSKFFPIAAGTRQSPVDIATPLVASDNSLQNSPLKWTFPSGCCKSIVNTGYCWKVNLDGEGSELSGGPLNSKYKLEQFHCHWGCTSDEGSEHTVDGKSYAGELHLVHWNCEKYSSFKEAAGYPDGLAVLGVFLQVSNEQNLEIGKIASLIPSILFKNQEQDINEDIDLSSLLPNTYDYWTYLGSLTTPPCLESVIWIVFKEPIYVTEDQISVFRKLKNISQGETDDGGACQVIKNYRPPLPLGNRVLRECGV